MTQSDWRVDRIQNGALRGEMLAALGTATGNPERSARHSGVRQLPRPWARGSPGGGEYAYS